MKRKVAWGRVFRGGVAVCVGTAAAYYGQPLIHGNSQAINIIVTVFSVLAGFLVAVIAIVGDPALLPPGSWRAAEMERSKLNGRLGRHKALFMTYLITLGLIFVSLLLNGGSPCLIIWIERAFLFVGGFGFLLSLLLPGVLIEVQRERIDLVIEHRRHADGIKPK